MSFESYLLRWARTVRLKFFYGVMLEQVINLVEYEWLAPWLSGITTRYFQSNPPSYPDPSTLLSTSVLTSLLVPCGRT